MRRLFSALVLGVLAGFSGLAKAGEFTLDLGLPDHGGSGYFMEAALDGKARFFPGASLGVFSRNGQTVGFADVHGGVRVPIGPLTVQGIFGVAGITRTTDDLGTLNQFRSSLFVGWKMGKTRARCGWTHFSNAKALFGWSGPNHGESYLTCGMTFPLR